MSKAKIIVIVILSLLMTFVALAQPTQKRTAPHQAAIWGMETPFGVKSQKTRIANRSLTTSKGQRGPKGIGGGAAGGVLVGGAVARTKTPRGAR